MVTCGITDHERKWSTLKFFGGEKLRKLEKQLTYDKAAPYGADPNAQNLCRGRPQPQYSLVRRAVPTLIKVLVENDKEDIITDICWALSYLSDGAKERINDLLNQNLLLKMI